MKTRFVCLANSHKHGGRCLAGIELDEQDDLVRTQTGGLRWIRPVWPDRTGAIPFYHVDKIRLLDIIEMDVTKPAPDGFQVENVQFEVSSIRVLGQYSFTTALLNVLTRREEAEVLGNLARSVSHKEAQYLNHSLDLIRVQPPFRLYTKLAGERQKEQLRLSFRMDEYEYDFAVTDPAFIAAFHHDSTLLIHIHDLYLCVSLGREFGGEYYKLVAGVLF